MFAFQRETRENGMKGKSLTDLRNGTGRIHGRFNRQSTRGLLVLYRTSVTDQCGATPGQLRANSRPTPGQLRANSGRPSGSNSLVIVVSCVCLVEGGPFLLSLALEEFTECITTVVGSLVPEITEPYLHLLVIRCNPFVDNETLLSATVNKHDGAGQ